MQGIAYLGNGKSEVKYDDAKIKIIVNNRSYYHLEAIGKKGKRDFPRPRKAGSFVGICYHSGLILMKVRVTEETLSLPEGLSEVEGWGLLLFFCWASLRDAW